MENLNNHGERLKSYPSALLIGGDPIVIAFIRKVFLQLPLRVITVSTVSEALTRFAASLPRIVLIDVEGQEQESLKALSRIFESHPGAEIILLAANPSLELVSQAIRRGALDVLSKPLNCDTIREQMLRWHSDYIKQVRQEKFVSTDGGNAIWHGMIGNSPPMEALFDTIRHIGPHYRTVLIAGETGTGKELIARAIHENSPVAKNPYITFNCASIADLLFESELFGHAKGAFTGAHQDHIGLIAAAQGGALFLDEVGELSLLAQAKLLRVLQTREVRPVGSAVSRSVDVRFIAATNRDLYAMVQAKTFREDLFYRLTMLQLSSPSLRDRAEDIPMLARYFVNIFARQFSKPDLHILPRALAALQRYQWPGNVRELENVIGAAALLTGMDAIDLRHLPTQFQVSMQLPQVPATTNELTLAEVSGQHIRSILRKVNNNRSKAAQVLGISRATLYRLLREPITPIE